MFKEAISQALKDPGSWDEEAVGFAVRMAKAQKDSSLMVELFEAFPSFSSWDAKELLEAFSSPPFAFSARTIRYAPIDLLTSMASEITNSDGGKREAALMLVADALLKDSRRDLLPVVEVFLDPGFLHRYAVKDSRRLGALYAAVVKFDLKDRWVDALLGDLRPGSHSGRCLVELFINRSDFSLFDDDRFWGQLKGEDLKTLHPRVSVAFIKLVSSRLGSAASEEVFVALDREWSGSLLGLLETSVEVS